MGLLDNFSHWKIKRIRLWNRLINTDNDRLVKKVFIGPMKGVILTPDIVKIFHPTPDIQAKKCPTPTLKIHPDTRHPSSKR